MLELMLIKIRCTCSSAIAERQRCENIKENTSECFYSASALLAMQSAVLARGILSVRLSVCLSVRHVPILCPDE